MPVLGITVQFSVNLQAVRAAPHEIGFLETESKKPTETKLDKLGVVNLKQNVAEDPTVRSGS